MKSAQAEIRKLEAECAELGEKKEQLSTELSLAKEELSDKDKLTTELRSTKDQVRDYVEKLDRLKKENSDLDSKASNTLILDVHNLWSLC